MRSALARATRSSRAEQKRSSEFEQVAAGLAAIFVKQLGALEREPGDFLLKSCDLVFVVVGEGESVPVVGDDFRRIAIIHGQPPGGPTLPKGIDSAIGGAVLWTPEIADRSLLQQGAAGFLFRTWCLHPPPTTRSAPPTAASRQGKAMPRVWSWWERRCYARSLASVTSGVASPVIFFVGLVVDHASCARSSDSVTRAAARRRGSSWISCMPGGRRRLGLSQTLQPAS